MFIISLLESKFPQFPHIDTEELSTFKELCHRLLKENRSLVRLSERYLSEQDKTRLNDHHFLEKLIVYAENQSKLHFMHMLQEDCFYETNILAIYVSKIWTYYIEQKLLNPKDVNPIYFTYHLSELFYLPHQMAGLLIALLKNNVHPDTIIQSGMLHNFFVQYSHLLQDIKTLYVILNERQAEHPFIPILLEKVHQTHCGIPSYPKTSLDAEINYGELETTEIKMPSSTPFFSQKQFENYLHLFQYEFIQLILHQPKISQVFSYFEQWYIKQDLPIVANIYVKVLENVHSSNLLNIFKLLIENTSSEAINHLFLENYKLFWIILALAPHHITLNKSEIITLARTQAINERNEKFIGMICKNRKLKEIQDELYHKLFQLQLSKGSNIEIESDIMSDLYAYKKTQIWCTMHDQKIFNELLQRIDFFTPHFDDDAYITLKDLFHSKRFELMILTEMGYESKYFPSSFYDFSSLLLNRLFIKNSQKKIQQWLEIFSYTIESKTDFQHRLLLEWFSYTENNDVLMSIALQLKNQFHVEQYEIHQLFKNKQKDFSDIAFMSPYNMDIFIQFYQHKPKLHFIMEKNKKHNKSLLQHALLKPIFLKSIITHLSDEELFELLNTEYKKQYIWFQIPIETSLNLLKEKLNSSYFRSLIALKNIEAHTIIDLHLANSKLIEQLFETIDPTHQTLFILRKNEFNENLLDLSLKFPETFILFYEKLNAQQKIECLFQKDRADQILIERTLSFAPIVIHLLSNFSEPQFVLLSEIYTKKIILIHMKNAEVLNILLRSLTASELYKHLISKNYAGDPFYYHLVLHPPAIAQVFEHLNSKLKFKLLKMKSFSLLEYLCKKHPSLLKPIFEKMQSQYCIQLINSDYFFFCVLQDSELLCHYFENLNEIQIKTFLEHHNKQAQNWVDLIPTHHLLLDCILSSTSEPSVQMNDKLILKFFKDPMCLNILLQYIPHRERKNWILSLHEPYFQHLVKIDSLTYLFRYLPQEEHITLLFWKHAKFHTMCQWLIQEFDKMIQLMPRLSEKTIDLINHKIIKHPEELGAFKKMPEKINTFFQFLTPKQQLEFLKALCQSNSSEQLDLRIKSIILKFAINYPTEIPSFSPRHFTVEQIKNPLWQSIKNARFFQDCLPSLERRENELNLLGLLN